MASAAGAPGTIIVLDSKWPYWVVSIFLGLVCLVGLLATWDLANKGDLRPLAVLVPVLLALLACAIYVPRLANRRGLQWDARGLVELRGRRPRVHGRHELAGLQVLYMPWAGIVAGAVTGGALGAIVGSDLPTKNRGAISGLVAWKHGADKGKGVRKPLVSQRALKEWLRKAEAAGLQVKHGH